MLFVKRRCGVIFGIDVCHVIRYTRRCDKDVRGSTHERTLRDR